MGDLFYERGSRVYGRLFDVVSDDLIFLAVSTDKEINWNVAVVN